MVVSICLYKTETLTEGPPIKLDQPQTVCSGLSGFEERVYVGIGFRVSGLGFRV